MKNIFTLLLIVLSSLFIGCSGNGDDDNNIPSQTFLEKYDGTFWKAEIEDLPTNDDYYGFKNEIFFVQLVGIEQGNNNQIICQKYSAGDYLQIKKNIGNEFWLEAKEANNSIRTLKFIVDASGKKMIVSRIYQGNLETSFAYQLSDLNYNYFCN